MDQDLDAVVQANTKTRSAVAGSNACSGETNVSICASAMRTGSASARARGRLHPNWAARQELIAAAAHAAAPDCGSSLIDRCRCGRPPGLAALREQRVESHQKIEVRPS